MSQLLDNQSITLLRKSLDSVWYRQQVIMNNIANSDTPGYKAKSVQFESLLKTVLEKGGNEDKLADAIAGVEPKLVENSSTSIKQDGNNVDLNSENIELARAELQYNYLASSLSSEISRLKYVINEGRG